MDKVKFLEWLKARLEAKNQQCDRLIAEGFDESECLCEWGIYRRVIDEIEKGTFDNQ